jgi:Mor family transcriptional regulator
MTTKPDPQLNISSLSPADFKALVNGKGWTYRDLAKRWKLTEVRISQIARDTDRPMYYDEAARGLPTRKK